MRSTKSIAALLVCVMAMAATPARAENPEGPDYQKGSSKIDLHRRYPGDRPLEGGNARVQGPEQGAYVEQCYWYARDTFLGLPWGFAQRCERHTLDSTQ